MHNDGVPTLNPSRRILPYVIYADNGQFDRIISQRPACRLNQVVKADQDIRQRGILIFTYFPTVPS